MINVSFECLKNNVQNEHMSMKIVIHKSYEKYCIFFMIETRVYFQYLYYVNNHDMQVTLNKYPFCQAQPTINSSINSRSN